MKGWVGEEGRMDGKEWDRRNEVEKEKNGGREGVDCAGWKDEEGKE